jgi:large subunit ribosomal protein L4
MAVLPVLDMNGTKVGDYEIDPSAIAPKISKQVLHDAVVMYQANLRQGTHRTKSRSEISYSTKKLYRQKGTGNARAGSRGSGVRRGGGHIFAKRPRDYSYRLPRKVLRAAARMAIASKLLAGQVIVVDRLDFDAPKSKRMAAALKAIGAGGHTALIATENADVNVYKSARNIAGVSALPVAELNALAVLMPRRIVVTRAALDALKSSTAG